MQVIILEWNGGLTSGSESSTSVLSNSIACHTLIRARVFFLKSSRAFKLKATVCFSIQLYHYEFNTNLSEKTVKEREMKNESIIYHVVPCKMFLPDHMRFHIGGTEIYPSQHQTQTLCSKSLEPFPSKHSL